MRRTHIPGNRRGQQLRRGRARSHHVQDIGRPDFLLQPARNTHRGGRGTDSERLCQRSNEQTPDGICRRGTETARHHPRRQRRIAYTYEIFRNIRENITQYAS